MRTPVREGAGSRSDPGLFERPRPQGSCGLPSLREFHRASADPIRVQVGEDEVLLDDSQRFVERAVAAGIDARLDVWQGMPHGFIGTIGQTQAAAGALSAIGEFLSSRLAPRSANETRG
jgi:acetyl esterase/lipase